MKGREKEIVYWVREGHGEEGKHVSFFGKGRIGTKILMGEVRGRGG